VVRITARYMDFSTFQQLPLTDIVQLVQRAGCKVCVFPINGTRRWFILEHPDLAASDFVNGYLQVAGQRHLELYRLFFEHGIQTLLTPIFGPDILERDSDYQPIIAQGLLWFAQNVDFLKFYDDFDVRVKVYGDVERYLRGTQFAHVLDAFAELSERTAKHTTHRLFFGLCAHDPAEQVAQIGVDYHRQFGRLPDKRAIVEAYYGEYVDPVDFFIGFDRPAAFDMPLIATGNEDLYFTVSPSPYLDAHTLRAILYDHLFTRRISEKYSELTPEDWQILTAFYRENRHHVLGIGDQSARGGVWYPLPQVNLPPQWQKIRTTS
jgi:tuberculosinol/isotuberculosinol synthase